MPMSIRRECPECAVGIGIARRALIVPGRKGYVVTLACQSCGHEWEVEAESTPAPPAIPKTPDRKQRQAS